jgi:cell division protein FtsB
LTVVVVLCCDLQRDLAVAKVALAAMQAEKDELEVQLHNLQTRIDKKVRP